MDVLRGTWRSASAVGQERYSCGYCGEGVAPSMGYQTEQTPAARVLICPGCNRPSYIGPYGEEQVPGPLIGGSVASVPDDIYSLYQDARRAASHAAYTSCVLTLRKILMHVAVEKSAKAGSFAEHVQHLADIGYLPPGAEGWVDYIRRRANEANHEIQLMDVDDATRLLVFTEALLKHVYELPGLIPPAAEETSQSE